MLVLFQSAPGRNRFEIASRGHPILKKRKNEDKGCWLCLSSSCRVCRCPNSLGDFGRGRVKGVKRGYNHMRAEARTKFCTAKRISLALDTRSLYR